MRLPYAPSGGVGWITFGQRQPPPGSTQAAGPAQRSLPEDSELAFDRRYARIIAPVARGILSKRPSRQVR